MSATDDPFDPPATPSPAPRPIPTGVQLVSTILFGAFAITATALAFDAFWPAGVALAALLGWRGGFVPGLNRGSDPRDEIIADLGRLSPEVEQRTSGSESFDAYRRDTLERLEDERESFAGFVDRLRSARDQREFDGFMDSRAAAARAARLDRAGQLDSAAP